MDSLNEQHAFLLESLERRARAFEAEHARRYSNNDLAADALWAEEMARYRALRLARACVRCVCVCVCARALRVYVYVYFLRAILALTLCVCAPAAAEWSCIAKRPATPASRRCVCARGCALRVRGRATMHSHLHLPPKTAGDEGGMSVFHSAAPPLLQQHGGRRKPRPVLHRAQRGLF